ncbi:MAG: 5'-nucleotidase C-terminal domain-containing protein [Bacteroidales bacterium]|nr:5'-nucleotidase C-terminal domain-containing protein [Bacteroidales bacterium]
MKRILLFSALLLMIVSCSSASNSGDNGFKYEWSYSYIDGRLDKGTNDGALQIINSYSELMAPMQEILGYSDAIYSKKAPDSGLSNFAVDAIREASEKLFGAPVEVGLTNFGGIREDLPKGAVRVYDIFTIFPFDNYLVVSQMKGSNLRKLLNEMAQKNKFEALSGVEIVCTNGKMTKCNVGGAPLDDNRVYHLGTINFLVEGGDGIRVGKYSDSITEFKDVMIRDVMCDRIKELTADGKTLHLEPDGRVIINK